LIVYIGRLYVTKRDAAAYTQEGDNKLVKHLAYNACK